MTAVDRLNYAEMAERERPRRSRSSRVRVRGALPVWVWSALYAASRNPADLPVVIVEDGDRELLLLDAADWTAVLAALEPGS